MKKPVKIKRVKDGAIFVYRRCSDTYCNPGNNEVFSYPTYLKNKTEFEVIEGAK